MLSEYLDLISYYATLAKTLKFILCHHLQIRSPALIKRELGGNYLFLFSNYTKCGHFYLFLKDQQLHLIEFL